MVWITGASSGIGEYIALALAGAGVKLVLSARRENELERVKQNCLSELVHCLISLSSVIFEKLTDLMKFVLNFCVHNVSEVGKNLTEGDVLVLPMDVMAVDKHSEHFQKVIDHFGEVNFYHFEKVVVYDECVGFRLVCIMCLFLTFTCFTYAEFIPLFSKWMEWLDIMMHSLSYML